MHYVTGSHKEHECGRDCDLQYSEALGTHIHVMRAADPTPVAGRYQWEQNQRIFRSGFGARKAYRATGQGSSRAVRAHDARRGRRDRRLATRETLRDAVILIGDRRLPIEHHVSERRIYRAVASHWTVAEELWPLFLSVRDNIDRQVRFYLRHGRTTDGGYYRGLGNVRLLVGPDPWDEDLTDAHSD